VATKPVTRSGSAGSFTYTTSTASDRGYLSFDSRGANNAGTVAFYKVCDAGSTSVKGRIVQVNVVGKISLDATNVTCP
jgi:Tfp pilus assembly protein FimT